ncbi:stage II sporulation protein AB (anti-sigma F factor) [Anaerobranca gottschalkii DSM 13577]|uniref:Anti-sigma F factor n=2 Tax=Anaerobranca gottschalkii TaxID=108328 RepID=A0A1H9Y146_9FIRM|nr:stage II sporulation protein AB (anti-sigma F factor) [Anaerobranca gottschalkii DSM 13577]
MENYMELIIPSYSKNESFARAVVGAFFSQLDPDLNDLNELKTAVSEAVTNAIIHGYPDGVGEIRIKAKIYDDVFEVNIIDQGVGIENIEQAREPLYTSKPEMERSGLGFSVMEGFMDEVEIISKVGAGTQITLRKKINNLKAQ